MKKSIYLLPLIVLGLGCADADTAIEEADPIDECVFCADEKADAFGIARESYLAYGILKVANEASYETLDDLVPLDRRAARGIVDTRPFDYIEQVDTVSYVGKTAFRNLSNYAQDNGFVPFCGDGELQPILEACDDGNDISDDGCSALCTVEDSPATAWFQAQSDLISGAEIGVGLVDPAGYYLRERRISTTSSVKAAVVSILNRADGINANAADGVVSWDELALMSKEPFLSSLFADEKAALALAWEILEVSTQDPVVIEYTGGPLQRSTPFNVKIERPGPLLVVPVRDIADLSSTQQQVSRRLQQMAGTNADGDNDTIELADLDKGIEDYAPVFTVYEVSAMKAIKDLMFNEATPSSEGDFAIEFESMPNGDANVQQLSEFDGWEFGFQTRTEVHHDAYNSDYNDDYFDGNLRTEFSFTTFLRKNGRSKWTCSSTYGGACSNAFRYEGVKFIRLDGNSTRPGSSKGVMLMEEWNNGKRVYNRVVDFKNTYHHVSGMRDYLNEYMAARPALADGTPLSLRSNGTYRYSRGRTYYTYNRFKLAKVQTEFNKNVEKFFPHFESTMVEYLQPGRYNEMDGVVLDIHESRAAIAYFDGCELPFAYERGTMETEVCPASGRHVEIDFSNGVGAVLRSYANGQRQEEADIYDINDIWNNGGRGLLGLDRSYYTIQ